MLLLGSQHYFVLFRQRAGPRDFNGQRCGSFDARGGQIVGGREPPGAPVEYTDTQTQGNGTRYVADFSVLGGNLAFLGLDQPHIAIGNPAAHRRIERILGYLLHRGVINPPSLSCSPEAMRGKRVEYASKYLSPAPVL